MAAKIEATPAIERASSKSTETEEKEFIPRGAIAFFSLMLGAFGLIWLGLYFLVLQRQFGL